MREVKREIYQDKEFDIKMQNSLSFTGPLKTEEAVKYWELLVAKHFIHIISFSSHHPNCILCTKGMIFPIWWYGSWGSEKSFTLLKVSQLSGRNLPWESTFSWVLFLPCHTSSYYLEIDNNDNSSNGNKKEFYVLETDLRLYRSVSVSLSRPILIPRYRFLKGHLIFRTTLRGRYYYYSYRIWYN